MRCAGGVKPEDLAGSLQEEGRAAVGKQGGASWEQTSAEAVREESGQRHELAVPRTL